MPRHSAEPPAPNPRPPGPQPSGSARPSPKPIDIVLDAPPRKRVRVAEPLGRRWRRRLARGARSRRGRWVLIALACLAVLLIGLLANGFLAGPPATPTTSTTPTGGPLAAGGGAATPPPSSAHSTKTTGTSTGDQAVLQTLRNRFPDNPLNHLRGAGVHQVLIEASSSETIPIVGWLVPTGLGNTYGTERNVNGHWSLSQQALGKGYLAAVFIQAGRDGAPITCRVIVDGKVTNTETTNGAYGRTVCLG